MGRSCLELVSYGILNTAACSEEQRKARSFNILRLGPTHTMKPRKALCSHSIDHDSSQTADMVTLTSLANQLFKVYIIMLLLLAFIFLEKIYISVSKKMNEKQHNYIYFKKLIGGSK